MLLAEAEKSLDAPVRFTQLVTRPLILSSIVSSVRRLVHFLVNIQNYNTDFEL